MLPDCKRFITIMEEADYVIKAEFPETTYIIVANFTYIFCVANITKSAFLRCKYHKAGKCKWTCHKVVIM